MRPEQKLLKLVEAYIATYGGGRKLREIKLLLLIQQASASGQGISPSRLSEKSGIPVETARRLILAEREAGLLDSVEDPNDDRATLIYMTDAGHEAWNTELISEQLAEYSEAKTDNPLSVPRITYDQLIFAIDILMEEYMDSIRIRGARMALLVMIATIDHSGVPVSQLAKLNNAPLETVRRILSQHVEMGHITYVDDPNDKRTTLVVTADLEIEINRVAAIDQRLKSMHLI